MVTVWMQITSVESCTVCICVCWIEGGDREGLRNPYHYNRCLKRPWGDNMIAYPTGLSRLDATVLKSVLFLYKTLQLSELWVHICKLYVLQLLSGRKWCESQTSCCHRAEVSWPLTPAYNLWPHRNGQPTSSQQTPVCFSQLITLQKGAAFQSESLHLNTLNVDLLILSTGKVWTAQVSGGRLVLSWWTRSRAG